MVRLINTHMFFGLVWLETVLNGRIQTLESVTTKGFTTAIAKQLGGGYLSHLE